MAIAEFPLLATASALDDVAERCLGGVFRGDGAGFLGQAFKVSLHRFEGGDALAELLGVSLDQRRHVATGSLASVPKGQGLSDLAQGEADRLGGADEPEPSGGVLPIVPIATPASSWGRHETDPLVVTDRRRLDPGALCQFPDAHRKEE